MRHEDTGAGRPAGKRHFRLSVLAAIALAGVLLAGCGEPAEPPGQPVTVADDGAVEVQIGSDDRMQYDVRVFTVPSARTVRLTLRHTGRLPIEQMGHNVVILAQGEDPVAFGREAQRGGNLSNHYLPEAIRDRVIAFTAMIGGGETDTIEFVSPAPGRYPFVCTFPGHFSLMRGVMVVE
jgi:azurin